MTTTFYCEILLAEKTVYSVNFIFEKRKKKISTLKRGIKLDIFKTHRYSGGQVQTSRRQEERGWSINGTETIRTKSTDRQRLAVIQQSLQS